MLFRSRGVVPAGCHDADRATSRPGHRTAAPRVHRAAGAPVHAGRGAVRPHHAPGVADLRHADRHAHDRRGASHVVQVARGHGRQRVEPRGRVRAGRDEPSRAARRAGRPRGSAVRAVRAGGQRAVRALLRRRRDPFAGRRPDRRARRHRHGAAARGRHGTRLPARPGGGGRGRDAPAPPRLRARRHDPRARRGAPPLDGGPAHQRLEPSRARHRPGARACRGCRAPRSSSARRSSG